MSGWEPGSVTAKPCLPGTESPKQHWGCHAGSEAPADSASCLKVWAGTPYHHPVLGVHDVDGAPGFLLHRGVDDAPGDPIDEEDAGEGALVMGVCALCHHSQQVGIQTLGREGTPPSASGRSVAHPFYLSLMPWGWWPAGALGILVRRMSWVGLGSCFMSAGYKMACVPLHALTNLAK